MKRTHIAITLLSSLTALAGGLPQLAMAATSTGPTPAGPAFQINAAEEPPAQQASVAVAEDGSFVVAWTAYTFSPQYTGSILAKRFAADGTPLSGEIVVASLNQNVGLSPYVETVIDGHGNFGVVWAQQAPSSLTPTMRLFTADGTARGAPFCALSGCPTTVGSPFAVGMDSSGNFVTALGEATQGTFAANITIDVVAQRFSSDGTPLTDAPFMVASVTNRSAYQSAGMYAPSIAMNRSSGDFAIGWTQEQDSYAIFLFEGYDKFTSSTQGNYVQAYNADGSAARDRQLIGSSQHSHVWTITNLNGFTQTYAWGYQSSLGGLFYDDADNLTAAWNRAGIDFGLTSCYQQRFDSSGIAKGPKAITACDAIAAGDSPALAPPTAAVNGTGKEVAVQTFAQQGQYGLSGETYDASGVKQQGKPFIIAQPPLQLVWPAAAVAMDPSGNFIVVWVQSVGTANAVMAQIYHAE